MMVSIIRWLPAHCVRKQTRPAAAAAPAGPARRSPARLVAGEEPVRHVEIFVDDHLRGRPARSSPARPLRARISARNTGSMRASGHSAGSASASIRSSVSCCATAARTMRANSGTSRVGHPALLEAAGARQFAQAMADELVDHRLRVVLRLLALKQRLHRGDARGGARPAVRGRVAGPSRRARAAAPRRSAARQPPRPRRPCCGRPRRSAPAPARPCRTVSSPVPSAMPYCSATCISPAIVSRQM